jgi:hypothetical protein
MRLRTAIVFGIGYVLGAKAGRDRYEQLRRAYRRATSNENVRKVIDQSKEVIDSSTAQTREAVAKQLSEAGEVIRQRAGGNGQA